MEECRLHDRIDYDWQCNLHLSDTFYLAKVKNISLVGALVHFNDSLPGVHVGDKFKMSLNGELICRYDCKVVRVDASHIAVRFIGFTM